MESLLTPAFQLGRALVTSGRIINVNAERHYVLITANATFRSDCHSSPSPLPGSPTEEKMNTISIAHYDVARLVQKFPELNVTCMKNINRKKEMYVRISGYVSCNLLQVFVLYLVVICTVPHRCSRAHALRHFVECVEVCRGQSSKSARVDERSGSERAYFRNDGEVNCFLSGCKAHKSPFSSRSLVRLASSCPRHRARCIDQNMHASGVTNMPRFAHSVRCNPLFGSMPLFFLTRVRVLDRSRDDGRQIKVGVGANVWTRMSTRRRSRSSRWNTRASIMVHA